MLKGHAGEVKGVVFSPDSRECLSVATASKGLLHDLVSGSSMPTHVMAGHGNWVLGCDWVGDHMLTVSVDYSTKVWSRRSNCLGKQHTIEPGGR